MVFKNWPHARIFASAESFFSASGSMVAAPFRFSRAASTPFDQLIKLSASLRSSARALWSASVIAATSACARSACDWSR